MKQKKSKEFRLQADVWIKIMAHLGGKLFKGHETYKMEIAKELDITYTHIVKILKVLEKKKYVKFRKQSRNIYIELTGVGIEVSEACRTVIGVTN